MGMGTYGGKKRVVKVIVGCVFLVMFEPFNLVQEHCVGEQRCSNLTLTKAILWQSKLPEKKLIQRFLRLSPPTPNLSTSACNALIDGSTRQ